MVGIAAERVRELLRGICKETNSKGVNLYIIGFNDKKENVKMFFNKNQSSLSSVYYINLIHLGLNLEDYEFVDLTSIDDFCANNFISEIQFLKLDVEGN